MRFDTLLSMFGDLPLFDVSMVVQLSGERRQTVLMQLHRWSGLGKLTRLSRGVYCFSNPYRRIALSPLVVANELYKPSYLTGVWALSYYGLIPGKAMIFTSAVTRVPRSFDNSLGTFQYFHLKREYFFGLSSRTIGAEEIWLAEPEKALIDFWYLNAGRWTVERMAEMRFQGFDQVDQERLRSYVSTFNAPRLEIAVWNWTQLSKNEREGVQLL